MPSVSISFVKTKEARFLWMCSEKNLHCGLPSSLLRVLLPLPLLLVLGALLTSFVSLVVVLKTNCAQLDWCLTMWTDNRFIVLNIVLNLCHIAGF